MPRERLVAVSYPVNEDYTRINADVLGVDADVVYLHELPDSERRVLLSCSRPGPTALIPRDPRRGGAGRKAAENVRRYLHGEPPTGVMNREDYL